MAERHNVQTVAGATPTSGTPPAAAQEPPPKKRERARRSRMPYVIVAVSMVVVLASVGYLLVPGGFKGAADRLTGRDGEQAAGASHTSIKGTPARPGDPTGSPPTAKPAPTPAAGVKPGKDDIYDVTRLTGKPSVRWQKTAGQLFPDLACPATPWPDEEGAKCVLMGTLRGKRILLGGRNASTGRSAIASTDTKGKVTWTINLPTGRDVSCRPAGSTLWCLDTEPEEPDGESSDDAPRKAGKPKVRTYDLATGKAGSVSVVPGSGDDTYVVGITPSALYVARRAETDSTSLLVAKFGTDSKPAWSKTLSFVDAGLKTVKVRDGKAYLINKQLTDGNQAILNDRDGSPAARASPGAVAGLIGGEVIARSSQEGPLAVKGKQRSQDTVASLYYDATPPMVVGTETSSDDPEDVPWEVVDPKDPGSSLFHVSGTPLAYCGGVLFSRQGNTLIAADARDGSVRWRKDLPAQPSAWCSTDGRVLVSGAKTKTDDASARSSLTGYDAASGERRLHVSIPRGKHRGKAPLVGNYESSTQNGLVRSDRGVLRYAY